MIEKLDAFHKTRLGYLVFGLVELGLTYVFALWALNTGSIWLWIFTIILLIGFLQNIGRMAVYKK